MTGIPTQHELNLASSEFGKREKRDAMYRVATFLVSHFWGRPADMADGLGVLLLTWNQAFYRYGLFDFEELEKFIAGNILELDRYRGRTISSLLEDDHDDIVRLFDELLEALKIQTGKSHGRRSPVGVAKALHLLAPTFFPLWDDKIARAYSCYYNSQPSEQYYGFCNRMKAIARAIERWALPSDKSILKVIDEYNYCKYTKSWI